MATGARPAAAGTPASACAHIWLQRKAQPNRTADQDRQTPSTGPGHGKCLLGFHAARGALCARIRGWVQSAPGELRAPPAGTEGCVFASRRDRPDSRDDRARLHRQTPRPHGRHGAGSGQHTRTFADRAGHRVARSHGKPRPRRGHAPVGRAGCRPAGETGLVESGLAVLPGPASALDDDRRAQRNAGAAVPPVGLRRPACRPAQRAAGPCRWCATPGAGVRLDDSRAPPARREQRALRFHDRDAAPRHRPVRACGVVARRRCARYRRPESL